MFLRVILTGFFVNFNAGEASRIRKCRGSVFALEEEPDVLRVFLPEENWPGWAMARAFGDFYLKNFGIISTYRKLTERDEFVVLATDGVIWAESSNLINKREFSESGREDTEVSFVWQVWDVLSNKEVAEIVSSVRRRSEAAKIAGDGRQRRRSRETVDSGGDRGRRPVDSAGDWRRRKKNSFLFFIWWRGGLRQPPPCTPRRCTLDFDFAMSSAGVDLTNFLKGWDRSHGFRRLG